MDILDKIREIALALPDVTERLSHRAPCFYVQKRRPICRYHDHHYGDDRISLWCPAYPDVRDDLVRNYPERFFWPPASAGGIFSDWLGIYLDGSKENEVDWHQVSALLEDAFRKVAPKRAVAKLIKTNKP